MTAALLSIVLAPLAAAVLSASLRGRARRLAGPISVAAAALSLGIAAVLWGSGAGASLRWFAAGRVEADLSMAMDPLSALMSVLVAGLCLVIDVYSVSYMRRDPRRAIFFAWMSFFAGAMLALVLAGSLILLFAAWEAVSVASYGLIAFHHRERAARQAAARAFLVTRLGDLGLLVSVGLLLAVVGDTTFSAVLFRAGSLPAPVAAAAGFGLLCAAVAKSAQLPLSAWLPDAMVAPTPVSALLHSATMVAAGVYLLVRFEPLLAAAPAVAEVALWIGAATALAAALAAATAVDLKRILAWSTVSNLGEMLVAVGHASPKAAVVHLTIHALFKACLFLVAGAVDQRTGERRIDRLAGLAAAMPIPALAFAIAGASLAGVPPTAGFFSDQALLGVAAAAGPGWVLFEAAILFLAGVYIGRAGVAMFVRRAPEGRPAAGRGSPLSDLAIGLLAIGAAAGGALVSPIEHWLAPAVARAPAGPASALGVAAGLLGLGFGAYRVLRAGPVPAFGAAPAAIERAAEKLLSLPAGAALAAGRALLRCEAWLDRAGRRAAALVQSAADAVTLGERSFDLAGRRATAWVVASARAVVTIERDGFSRGGDELAAAISRSGATLRRMQNGKIYFYTAGLFVAALAAGGALVLLVSG